MSIRCDLFQSGVTSFSVSCNSISVRCDFFFSQMSPPFQSYVISISVRCNLYFSQMKPLFQSDVISFSLCNLFQSVVTSISVKCNLFQSAISNIANWKYSNTLSKDKCQEFGQWYKEYKTHGHGKPIERRHVISNNVTFSQV